MKNTVNSQNIILYWLASLPLITDFKIYEGPKVLWFFGGSLFLIAVNIFHSKTKFTWATSQKIFLLLICWFTLTSIFGILPFDSIIGGDYRHQGVFLFALLLIDFLLLKNLYTLAWKQRLFNTFKFVAVLEALLVIYQVGFNTNLFNDRPLGTLGEPNSVAIYLALSSVLFTKTTTKIKCVVLVLIFIAIILTQSKTGLAAFLVMFFISSLQFIKSKLSKITLTVIFSLLLIIILTIFLNSSAFYEGKFENRPLLWGIATQIISNQPWVGFGLESTTSLYDLAFRYLEMPLHNYIIDRTHNIFLDIAVWSGIIGVTIFSAWLIAIIKEAFVTNSWTKLAAIFGFILFTCFQPVGVVAWVLLFCIIYLH